MPASRQGRHSKALGGSRYNELSPGNNPDNKQSPTTNNRIVGAPRSGDAREMTPSSPAMGAVAEDVAERFRKEHDNRTRPRENWRSSGEKASGYQRGDGGSTDPPPSHGHASDFVSITRNVLKISASSQYLPRPVALAKPDEPVASKAPKAQFPLILTGLPI
jgi:hypothetical protein